MRALAVIGSILVGTLCAIAVFALILPIVAGAAVFALIAVLRSRRPSPDPDPRRGDFDAAA